MNAASFFLPSPYQECTIKNAKLSTTILNLLHAEDFQIYLPKKQQQISANVLPNDSDDLFILFQQKIVSKKRKQCNAC